MSKKGKGTIKKTKPFMFRIVRNCRCNDFNREPEFVIIKYYIVGEGEQCGIPKYLVERAGWEGKKHQHWIPKRQFHTTYEEAEKALNRMEV